MRATVAGRRHRVAFPGPSPLLLLPLLLAAGVPGCSPFAAVKPARVTPGPSMMIRGAVTPVAQEIVGWMNSPYCAEGCSGAIFAPEIDFAWGSSPEGVMATEIGAGLSGGGFYLEAYAQLVPGPFPMGVGGRVGRLGPWGEYAVHGRIDVPLDRGHALLLNPGVFVASGESPNGANHATLRGFNPGVGYLVPGRRSDLIFSASPMLYAADRTRYDRSDSERGLLFTLSVAWRLHRSAAP